MRPLARRLATTLALSCPHGYDLFRSSLRYQALYRLGRPHEPEFWGMRRLNVSDRPVVADVGANIGQSVLSIYAVLPSAQVVSFEPNPEAAARLQRLVARFPTLAVHQCGLDEVAGEAELFIPCYKRNVLTGLASFDRQMAQDWLGSHRMVRFDPRSLQIRAERVPLRRLDDFDIAPDFVKLDVQGLEGRVLRGAMDTIRRCRPVIMAETQHPEGDAHRLLGPLGYELVEYDGRRFVPVASSPRRLNQFFVPRGRLSP